MSDQECEQPEGDFIPVSLHDADAWDDSALIAAFDRATSTHCLSSDKPPSGSTVGKQSDRACKRRRVMNVSGENMENGIQNRKKKVEIEHEKNQRNELMEEAWIAPPPPPKGASKELVGLLSAWYEAGYRAGCYAAAEFKRPGHEGVQ